MSIPIQQDPIVDFAEQGLAIPSHIRDAIGHHLRNALMYICDDSPDSRRRAFRRLRALADAIDAAVLVHDETEGG